MESCYITDSVPRPTRLHSARRFWNPVQPLARRGGRDDHESSGGLTRAVERTGGSLADCEHLTLELEWNDFGYSTPTIPVLSAGNRLFTPSKNPFHDDPLKGVTMRRSEEVDRKLNQVLTEMRTIQVELKIVKRAVDESRAADVGMASMTAEDIELTLNKILERLG